MRKQLSLFSILGLAVLWSTAGLLAQAPPAQVARHWFDRQAEIEAYLKSADVVDTEEIGVGVTRPRRATLAPGAQDGGAR